MALGNPLRHACGVVVWNTITAFDASPANVPDPNVPLTTVAAAPLVVVNPIVELVPLLQLTVALPTDEPLPHPRFPEPVADTLPPLIPLTPLQLEKLPVNEYV